MQVRSENSAEEIRRLRSCVNDLLSLLALPALWTGQEPREIVKTLLDALVGMLRLDFIYARLDSLVGSAPFEAVRLAEQQKKVTPAEVGQALESWLKSKAATSSFVIPNPVGEGEVSIASFPLDLKQENRLIVVGSRRRGFPTETETLLLKVAANQTAIALEGVQLAARRKQAEEAVRQRTAQFETLLNEAPLGVYVVDADFRIGQVNPTALPVFGDIPDLLGRDFDEVIHILWPKANADEIVRIFRHTLETGEPYYAPEWSEERRDRGVVEYYEWQINRIPLSDGRYGVVCYFRDISAQVLARLAIAESEKRYRGIFSQSVAGLAETDATGRFTNVNDRFCEMVGYSREELLQMRKQEITHAEDLPASLVLFNQLLDDGTSFEIEKRYVRKDGSLVWVHNSVSPLRRAAGRTLSLFAISVDITERKRMEEALKLADRRKDEFLALLAHELRNPLAPIRSATQVMKRVGPADPMHQWAREVIERQTQHLTKLVDDLLDVSRITQGKIALQRETLELSTIINYAVETSRPLLEARHHRLTITLPPEPVRVEGDLTRLVQVVANLLNNAAKYTDEGGHIQLQAAREAGEAVIRVSDNGMGLPAELLPHVFDLFTQADRSLDRSQGGLGIGLTLVRSLVELHGGRVEARSSGPGQGSEFVVRLPALASSHATDAAKPAGAHAQSAPHTLKILVVEDNPDSAEMMSFMLRFDGHEVCTARDGPSALELARLFEPQVVLCDIGLPGMTGYEVAQRLRQQPALKQASLIALTGYGQEEARRQAKEAGFDYHLVKPVDPEALGALLGSLRPTVLAN